MKRDTMRYLSDLNVWRKGTEPVPKRLFGACNMDTGSWFRYTVSWARSAPLKKKHVDDLFFFSVSSNCILQYHHVLWSVDKNLAFFEANLQTNTRWGIICCPSRIWHIFVFEIPWLELGLHHHVVRFLITKIPCVPVTDLEQSPPNPNRPDVRNTLPS